MSTVSTFLHNPSSFHPISRVNFKLEPRNTRDSRCSLNLVYKLPPLLFVDPYELAQRHTSYAFVKWGITELEKPMHAIAGSDTKILLTVNMPSHSEETETVQFDVEVPLHARYLPPSSKGESIPSGNYRHIPLERPQSFFACHRHLGQESYTVPPVYISASQLAEVNMTFTTTQFIHIPYSPNNPVDFIRIPVGRQEHMLNVQLATAAVIFFVFFWVGSTTIQSARRSSGCGASRTKTN